MSSRPIRVSSGLFLALLFIAPTINAALISSVDDQYTIDNESGLEWLDLTYTVGYSHNEVLSQVGGVVGGGWRHASNNEIEDLFVKLFPYSDVNATSRTVNPGGAQYTTVLAMQNLFGGAASGLNFYSWGLFEDETGVIRMMGSYTDPGNHIIYSPNASGFYSGPFTGDYSFSLTGSYLVRDGSAASSVSLSSTSMLLAFGLLVPFAPRWRARTRCELTGGGTGSDPQRNDARG